MPFMSGINPKLQEKTCCSLLIINLPSLQYATISMNMYVLCCFVLYKFTVHCIVYSKLLSQVTSLH